MLSNGHCIYLVIYAFNDDLPIDDDIPVHNKSDCGSKAVNLLLGETSDFELPDQDIDSFEVHFTDYEVPSDDTTYFCQLLAFPEKTEINHIIRIDPIITPGNEGIVHHILLTACAQEYVNPEDVGTTQLCDEWHDMPTNASLCRNGAIFAAYVYIWICDILCLCLCLCFSLLRIPFYVHF